MGNTKKTKVLKEQNKIKQIKMKEKRNYAYSACRNHNNSVNTSRSDIKSSIRRWRINKYSKKRNRRT